MKRTILLSTLLMLAACHSESTQTENRRSTPVKHWLGLGEEMNANGFAVSNGNAAYGSPYVLERQYFVDLDAQSEYAIEEGDFEHRCGDDARITREFAIIGAEKELVIARSFEGQRAFDRVPTGFVRLLALVFTDRSCQISLSKFSMVKAKLAPPIPDAGNDPEPIADEFGATPEVLLGTTWLRDSEDSTRWVFEFAQDGSGIFGFRSDDVTIRAGTLKLKTDAKLDDQHVVIEIIEAEDLPADAAWQKNTIHYCRYRVAGDEGTRSLDLICSEPDVRSLPEATIEIDVYKEIPPSSDFGGQTPRTPGDDDGVEN